MKKIVVILIVMLFAVTGVQAQGTLHFAVTLNGASQVPSNSSEITGGGNFVLDGNIFSGQIYIYSYAPTGAGVHGPADSSSLAPVLFGLTRGPDFTPWDGEPGGSTFTVSRVLSVGEINDLSSGLWYVNVYTDIYPNGEIRGQIVAVPEPATVALFGLGMLGFFWSRRCLNKMNTSQTCALRSAD